MLCPRRLNTLALSNVFNRQFLYLPPPIHHPPRFDLLLCIVHAQVIRHRLGPKSEVYAYLGPETGEVVRNMVAGGASSIVTQFFTVPVDIISQASRRLQYNSGGRASYF